MLGAVSHNQGVSSFVCIQLALSQAVNALEMRRTRYRGLTKTHLQHVATAAAMNLVRVVNWLYLTRMPAYACL